MAALWLVSNVGGGVDDTYPGLAGVQFECLASTVGKGELSDRHKPGHQQWSREVVFGTPTADTGQLITAAVQAFTDIYDKAASYHRASVTLYDFSPAGQLQTDLLGEVDPALHSQKTNRLTAVDGLNKRYGKNTIHYATQDLANNWEPRKLLRSPRYTTNWDELVAVRPLRP